MKISCAFATSFATPDHVAEAERLGYERAWFYDSPALYPDVWVTMALAAQRTDRIGLGPGVLVPNLRHVMTNAAAIATLAHLAPGRLAVAVGSGFTGRMTLGQRPLPWAYVREYVVALRGLLRGETVDWDGSTIRMMHPEGFAPPRPVDVPVIVAVAGPKGIAVAHEIADGVFGPGGVIPGFDWCTVLTMGTVLDDGEDPASDRVIDAAGHAAAVSLHWAHLFGDGVQGPGADEWNASLHGVPERERHLALHDLHLIGVNDRDRPLLTGELLRAAGARTRAEWRDHLARAAEQGATEIAYQPAGPDIPGELARFAEAAGLY